MRGIKEVKQIQVGRMGQTRQRLGSWGLEAEGGRSGTEHLAFEKENGREVRGRRIVDVLIVNLRRLENLHALLVIELLQTR
jgi:hypothetical protein